MRRACHSLKLSRASSISKPESTACSGSSPLRTGAPKKAIKPSPMYLSTIPPWSKTIFTIFSKYTFRVSTTSLGSSDSEMPVKLRTSENSRTRGVSLPGASMDSGLAMYWSRTCRGT